jgi:hypothetical protein
MRLLYDTYRGNDSLEISAASLKRWQREYDSLLSFMSADFRDLIDGLYARVYLVGSDLVIESEACGGAVQRVKNKKTGKVKRLSFDPHYEVMTVAVADAKKHMWTS